MKKDLLEWVLTTPRVDFVSANKEGLVSLPGTSCSCVLVASLFPVEQVLRAMRLLFPQNIQQEDVLPRLLGRGTPKLWPQLAFGHAHSVVPTIAVLRRY